MNQTSDHLIVIAAGDGWQVEAPAGWWASLTPAQRQTFVAGQTAALGADADCQHKHGQITPHFEHIDLDPAGNQTRPGMEEPCQL